MFLIEFLTQVLSNDIGRNFWENCCMNCSLLNVIRSGSGKIWSFLKRGSVWDLYDAPAIILTADFCILNYSFRGPDLDTKSHLIFFLPSENEEIRGWCGYGSSQPGRARGPRHLCSQGIYIFSLNF